MSAPVESLLHAHVEAMLDTFGPTPAGNASGSGAVSGGGGSCDGDVACFFAPGRVNLMGAHLDYNGGPVMPTAIDRGTFLAARRRPDRRVRFASTSHEARLEVDLAELAGTRAENGGPGIGSVQRHRTGSWSDYPLGVLLHELQRCPEAPGLDLFFGGNLTIGAGLSSSASICVGTALALHRLWGLDGGPLERVEAALWAEREFVGVHCGIMDPYAVAFSRPDHLLWLDCRDRTTAHLPLDANRVRIAVADTGVRRELARGDFNQRVAECADIFEALRPAVPGAVCLRDIPAEVVEDALAGLSDVLARRARHVVAELRRTYAARCALESGDVAAFGAQMSAAHESLRTLFEVSIPELDTLVDGSLAWPGCFGARLTGAGFGGCIVALVDTATCDGFAEHLSEYSRARHGQPVTVELFGGDPGPREVGGPWVSAAV